MLHFCDFIQVYVFTTNHHLNLRQLYITRMCVFINLTGIGYFDHLWYIKRVACTACDLHITSYYNFKLAGMNHRRHRLIAGLTILKNLNSLIRVFYNDSDVWINR